MVLPIGWHVSEAGRKKILTELNFLFGLSAESAWAKDTCGTFEKVRKSSKTFEKVMKCSKKFETGQICPNCSKIFESV